MLIFHRARRVRIHLAKIGRGAQSDDNVLPPAMQAVYNQTEPVLRPTRSKGDPMQTMIPLKPGSFYHIFNRGINRENIFFEERNYAYFLNLYARHIEPVADTYAYSLLRNHFHILVRIKPGADYKSASVSKAFNNLFTAYAKAINKAYGRTGALFQHHFGRIPITSDRYFTALARYIHRNPQSHGLVRDFRDWPYSSFQILASHTSTFLPRAEILGRFGGVTEFRKFHAFEGSGKRIRDLTGNDFN
jgi:putative transposase